MSAVIDVTTPDIGDFKDFPVIEILVKAGDYVPKGAPLVVLESDKATLDVPSPQSGTVGDLKIEVGDKVSVGSKLLTMNVTGGAPEATSAPSNPGPSAPVVELAPVSERSAKVVPTKGEIAGREPKLQIVRRPPHASPSIRRMSREFGIDLGAVRRTGPRGRILKEDVHRFAKAMLAAPSTRDVSSDLGALKSASWPVTEFLQFGKIEPAPLSKLRKLSGSNRSRNSVVIPHVTNFEDADVIDIEELRRTLKVEMKSTPSGITSCRF